MLLTVSIRSVCAPHSVCRPQLKYAFRCRPDEWTSHRTDSFLFSTVLTENPFLFGSFRRRIGSTARRWAIDEPKTRVVYPIFFKNRWRIFLVWKPIVVLCNDRCVINPNDVCTSNKRGTVRSQSGGVNATKKSTDVTMRGGVSRTCGAGPNRSTRASVERDTAHRRFVSMHFVHVGWFSIGGSIRLFGEKNFLNLFTL